MDSNKSSRVGVLDKSMAILEAVEHRPHSLADLTESTGLSRPTAHRLALALEEYGLLRRNDTGEFLLGPRIPEMAAAADSDGIAVRARPILRQLRDNTSESAQLYQRSGDRRICVATADLSSGLRDTVPLGAALTMSAGSAAQVLLAWAHADQTAPAPTNAAFSTAQLAEVRTLGWAVSVGEREPEVASVSAPVLNSRGRAIAAISISGPAARLGDAPATRFAEQVVAAGDQLSQLLARG